ncbi:MAG: triose-phosphate isomerase, partial [Oscillospiraceae bacterium]
KALKGSKIHLGAQNCHWAKSGAFTGEISADMLVELGCEYVILGHSERRQYFGETDETVNRRTKAALEAGLRVILCVGETLEQREGGETTEVLHRQMTEGLRDLTQKQMAGVGIAYEPVWAIGTGKTATADQAGEVCAFLRGILAGLYGEEAAYAAQIQYGGSMNAKNAAELLDQYDIDGGLIGGASLKAPDFAEILKAASRPA